MSDDEGYYDSSYEDLHDILYDADPSPDLADDLAEHTAYSPVWQENPATELQTYFSDWEYYSDDYYDDDPKMLKSERTGENRLLIGPEKRGRKRKLVEITHSGHMKEDEKQSLIKCIQGTVWAGPPDFTTRSYRQGDADKVALKLSDAVMLPAYGSKQGFGKGRLRRDESWANDLSLADMGLLNEREIGSQQGIEFDADEMESGDDENEKDEDNPSMNSSQEAAIEAFKNDADISQLNNNGTSDGESNHASGRMDSRSQSTGRNRLGPRKRRRLINESKIVMQSSLSGTSNALSGTSEDLSDSPKMADEDAATDVTELTRPSSKLPEVESLSEQPVVVGQKRKNSVKDYDEPPPTGRRAKRAALSKLSSTKDSSDKLQTQSTTRTTTRTTRSRKK